MRLDTCLPKHRAWLLLCLLTPLTAAAVTADDYAYRYPLKTTGSSPAWRVELTPAVYAASRPGTRLRDIVVVNAQGQPVPFAPMPATPPRLHPFRQQAALLPLPASSSNDSAGVRVQRNSNGDIVIEQPTRSSTPARPDQWLLDAHREVNLEQITMDPTALPVDARFHLSVQASNDLQSWSTRRQDVEIVSVKRGAGTLAQHAIVLNRGAPARYYRLSLSPGDMAPWKSTQTPQVELRGSYADPQSERPDSRRWLTLSAAPLSPANSGGIDYDYVLPAAMPVEAVRTILAGDNTVARFELLDHDDGDDQLLATITAVRIGEAGSEDPTTRFASRRVRHLRLHTDTPLSQPPTLQVAWRPDVFVFLAEGSGPYSLLAGSYAARRSNYPLSTAMEHIRPVDAGSQWQPPLATLGNPVDAAGPGALLAPKPPFDWTRPLLWLVLIGGALVVAGMAWSLLRPSSGDDEKH